MEKHNVREAGDRKMERRNLTFRVFVSSTFSDLKAGWNALQEHVFPGCASFATNTARFQTIDSRLGLTKSQVLQTMLEDTDYVG